MSLPDRIKIVWMPYIASPLRIRICESLQKYMDAKFLFFDDVGHRPTWWKYPLNSNTQILDNVFFKKQNKYLTLSHLKILNNFNPDVVVLPGFTTPTNFITYLWCKVKRKKVVVFTERLRNSKGELRNHKGVWKLIRFFYRNVDLVMVATEDTVPQLRDEFRFGDKVVASAYGSMIDDHLCHSPRLLEKRPVKLIFPNRLIEIYNPIAAIDIFYELQKDFSEVVMSMNADGELRTQCEERIKELDLNDKISFLNEIKGFDHLSNIYAAHDIMILPAIFSNGNFTIYEAMASGMGIVISTKVLGNGPEIENGINGFNVEPEVSLFVDAIKKYIEEPSLLLEHSIINKEKCKRFGIEETAKLYYEQIKMLFPERNI